MNRLIVEDHFHRFGQEIDQAMTIAIIEGAEATLHAARTTVPKGATGRLERSLHIGPLVKTRAQLTITVYASRFYGRFLEYGTKFIAPRYFMVKASQQAEAAYALAITRQIRRLGL